VEAQDGQPKDLELVLLPSFLISSSTTSHYSSSSSMLNFIMSLKFWFCERENNEHIDWVLEVIKVDKKLKNVSCRA
jgi:hypothetical protein